MMKKLLFKKLKATKLLKGKNLIGGLSLCTLLLSLNSVAQGVLSPKAIKKLSVEELMNIEVTLVTRTPEKLTEAASAIQVITNEDIRRSGATNVPEALRLLPNLQVSQLSSSAWIISARGFNSTFSNKLLVMIDGRTVYTPLYGGVLWEQQNLLLEDVDHIEVVSGPGGSLWGANAVNGVINIITKNSKDTQGLFASALVGDFLKNNIELRYGSKIGDKFSYRVYGQHFDRDASILTDSTNNTDAWGLTQGGFRSDWDVSDKDAITIQGNYYKGSHKTAIRKSRLNGQNLVARWSRTISEHSDLMVQLYYDRYYREDATTDSYDKMKTIDANIQHSFGIRNRQKIVWGIGYRYVKDDANYKNPYVGILPRYKRLDLYNSFIQDEIKLTDSLRLTIGTKLVHNVYTGFELQPSARLAWMKKTNTLWAAVSRAVRTPSRFDVDFYVPTTLQPPNVPSVAGGPNFVSEKLIAYEVGYRFQPNAVSSFSIAGFYNIYDDLYSVEALPGTLTYQIQNGSEAKSWGVELAGNYQVHKNWRLRGGYSFFKKNINAKKGHNFNPDYLGNDVRNRVMLQSILDLPFHLKLDIAGRYLDGLPKTIATTVDVPAYSTFDVRLAYVIRGLEIALVGQNLAEKKHTEYGPFYMPRNFYAKISTRF
jgi:iron complex outermembrane receptor protein